MKPGRDEGGLQQRPPGNSSVVPVARLVRRAIRGVVNGYALRRLALAHGPEGRIVADVVRQANGPLSDEDRAPLMEIENHR